MIRLVSPCDRGGSRSSGAAGVHRCPADSPRYEKLANIENFADAFCARHLPFPILLSYVAAFSEVIGSWLLITDLTRVGTTIAGTITIHLSRHRDCRFQHLSAGAAGLYLAAAATVLACGPGLFSIDELIARRFDAAPAETLADADVHPIRGCRCPLNPIAGLQLLSSGRLRLRQPWFLPMVPVQERTRRSWRPLLGAGRPWMAGPSFCLPLHAAFPGDRPSLPS